MKYAELSYLAGIIDGEGCINIVKYHKENRYRYRLQVRVINTSKELVEWIKENFGGYVTSRERKGYRLIYEWGIFNTQAEELLEDILEYLIIKKPQANVALDFRATLGKTQYRQGGLSLELIDMRDAMKEAISRLNKGLELG